MEAESPGATGTASIRVRAAAECQVRPGNHSPGPRVHGGCSLQNALTGPFPHPGVKTGKRNATT